MTRERDIERVLERWFTEGPTQMPDHFYNGVLDRIDRVQQRRLARLETRFAAMSLNLRIAAAAAIIVAVAGIGAMTLGGLGGVGVSPSPSPSASPSPTPTPSPTSALLPVGLRHFWVGETRTIPAIVPAPVGSGMQLAAGSMLFDGGESARNLLSSDASALGPDRLRFVLKSDGAGCTQGDVGTYTFVLSPGGGSLSLTADEDACVSRSQAISGDWARSACPNQGGCLGDLEAGDHVSVAFNPFVPITDYVYDYGRLSYSTPEGWSNIVDGQNGYILAKQDAPENAAIYVFSTALADSQADGCPGTVEPGVGTTASALASWLTTLPGLATTTPAPVTIGGLTGMTVDVSVDPTWTRTCPYSNGKPAVAMFTNGQYAEGLNFDWGLTAGAHMRLILLDLPDGRTLLIDVEAQDQAAWDALVADAMPVIDSFQFNP